MYIGEVQQQKVNSYILEDVNKQIIRKEIDMSIGLCGIIDEILVNAADNLIHSKTKMSYIKVFLTKNSFSVQNDGDAIPIQKNEDGKWIPEFIFANLLTSSNYDTKKRITGGMNGYGAKLTNLLSLVFKVEICNKLSAQKYQQTFQNNMSIINEPLVTAQKKENYTKIYFEPDFSIFQCQEFSEDMISLITRRVADLAGTIPNIQIYLNDIIFPFKSFRQYCVKYNENIHPKTAKLEEQSDDVFDKWIVYASVSENPKQVAFVNNIAVFSGTHVDFILSQICQKLKVKIGTQIEVSLIQIRKYVQVYISCTVPNPSFSNQSKHKLASKIDSDYKVSDLIIEGLIKDGIKSFLMQSQETKLKKTLNVTKTSKIIGIPKLDDANFAGTKQSQKCTLIVTEGDSAKSLAVAGFEVVGRDYFGAFPLKGKFLNVRTASLKQIVENKEIQELCQIIGLDIKNPQQNIDSLRYGSIMIMADQDYDGSHIKGLIINFIHFFWPSLCFDNEVKFLKYFRTPIIKASYGKYTQVFYSIQQYEEWRQNNQNIIPKIKYYKGLGTSTSAESKEYFSQLQQNTTQFISNNFKIDNDKIELAFHKNQADQRKNWIFDNSSKREEQLSNQQVTFQQFIDQELVQFSIYDCKRSLPQICDGLKPGQRKILYACFKKNLVDEIKVAQLAGYVAEQTSYHHGEVSLCQTIIQMAQDYVGSNNINLLNPIGQFGNRIMGNDGAASPRYIFTSLNKLTKLIFREEDELVLNFLSEDSKQIEPEYYLPIIPMILINGVKGIGTGWSTNILPCDTNSIFQYIFRFLNSEDNSLTQLIPFYKGFTGKTIINNEKIIFQGNIKKIGKKIVIDEVPPEFTVQKYKEYLDELMTKKIISHFTEHHQENKIYFEVFGFQEDESDLIKSFKLHSQSSLSNLVMFNQFGEIKKYANYREIIQEYCEIRLKFYEIRKISLIKQMQNQYVIYNNKARFVKMVISQEIQILGKKSADVEQQLISLDFTKIDNSFKYMTSLSIYQFTAELSEKILKQAQQLLDKIKQLNECTPQQLWQNDLQELIQAMK